MSLSCENDEDYHSFITFENQSENLVIFGLQFTNNKTDCLLDGPEIKKNQTYKFRPYNSWIENNLSQGKPIEIYIIDIQEYNDPHVFYDCDSIAIKNKILKQYTLTLEDLKRNDFKIVYP